MTNTANKRLSEIFGIDPTAPASEEQEKAAYAYLGRLATTFSEIEKNLRGLIGSMEGLQFVGYKLIDDNTLERNLHLLETINKWRKFKENEVATFIDEIRKLKKHRNSLIHGKWEIFLNHELNPVVAVREYKTKITKEENGHPSFSVGHQTVYTFSELTALIEKCRRLNEALKDILAAHLSKDHPGSEPIIRNAL